MANTGPTETTAPFYCSQEDAPPNSATHWVRASDGVNLRIGLLGRGDRGTVLCFPGRTEYVEKYTRVASDLAKAGFGVLAIDWRGQGLADRLAKDPMLGHVDRFDDYQRDVAAMVSFAEAHEMAKPWHLLAHSMGGAIGLRALSQGLKVDVAMFSAPMWGLTIPPLLRPLAKRLPGLADSFGYGQAGVPFTGTQPYVLKARAEDNLLTSDLPTFRWFRDHVRSYPQLALGTPTMRWLREAREEFRRFEADPPPELPCHVFLGSDEAIVSPKSIHDLVARWPGANLSVYEGGRHEVLMERPEIRDAILAEVIAAIS